MLLRILPLLFIANLSIAQKYPFFDNYKWEKDPVQSSMIVKDQLYYYTKYTLAIEYEFDDYYGRYFKYKTEHYRVKLNSHVAIEEFNKIYISMEDVVNLKSVKVRVIKPNQVVELKPKVEEFYSDDESEQYYYFPVSGIELGDELEILYTLKMESAVDGDQFFFQGEAPIYNFDFYFICPNDSYFSFLAHNKFPKPELVDTILHRHQWVSHLDTIPAYKVEYFSEYNNSSMKLDATLRGFESPTDKSYSPFDNFEENLNAVYNVIFKGKDLKAIKMLSEKLELSPRKKTEENIRIIENYIKMNISSDDIPFDTPMSTIIETERAGTIGKILLFMALFTENDIRFEYGFTSDRYDTHFSDEIESMHFLQSYIFYFPDIDKYLAPLDFSTRLGYLDKNWIPNNALLFTMKQYPKPETKGTIRAIPSTSALQNMDSTIVRIKIRSGFEQLDIEIERHLTGYDAGEFQTYYYLYNNARREIEEEDLLDVLNDNSKFQTISVLNTNPEDAFVKPLIIKGKVTELNVPLIEYAGSTIIFKIGYLFGEYTDLKEIDKKKTDFVFGNPFCAASTVILEFEDNVKITVPQEVPDSDDLSTHPDIRISSHLTVNEGNVVYHHSSRFEKNRYSIDTKPEMMDVFRFWNSLHKMNLIVEKKG